VKDFADLLTKPNLSVIIKQEFKIGGENIDAHGHTAGKRIDNARSRAAMRHR